MLIDSHAHLYWDSFQEDYDAVIERAIAAGVTTIINIGVDIETSRKVAGLTNDKIKFYSAIGIHPHEAIKYSTDESIHKDIAELTEIFHENSLHVLAIGECGLDFKFENNPDLPPTSLSESEMKELQIKLFQAQIDLARKLNLPLSVHCREAELGQTECWDKVLEMLTGTKAILHCYSGQPQHTQKVIESDNFLVSFAANVTYPKNDWLREAIKSLPLEKIILETDCPFLAPQSKRGQRNEPAAVLEVAQTVAEVKGISVEEVAKQTTSNVFKFLNLKD